MQKLLRHSIWTAFLAINANNDKWRKKNVLKNDHRRIWVNSTKKKRREIIRSRIGSRAMHEHEDEPCITVSVLCVLYMFIWNVQRVEFQLLFPIFIWAKMDGIPQFIWRETMKMKCIGTPFSFGACALGCECVLYDFIVSGGFLIVFFWLNPTPSSIRCLRFYAMVWISWALLIIGFTTPHTHTQILWANNTTAAFDCNFMVINKISLITNIWAWLCPNVCVCRCK